MTLDEFFQKLPRDGWRVWENGNLRRASGTLGVFCCPITATDPRQLRASQFPAVIAALGLSKQDAGAIASAADNWPGHDPALRARLLQHCGLSEQSQ